MNKFITKESEHYIFHFLPDSLAENDIDRIIECQENDYHAVVDFLGAENSRRIHYFLYPSNKIKGEVTGDDGNGHADRKKFKIHAVYNEKVKCIGPHEDTHLLATPIGLPPQLLREGLAEYLSKTWDGKSHDYWAAKFLADKKIPSIDEIIDDEKWYEVSDKLSYPIAGSFIGYLIGQLGKNKFLKLYGALNRDFSPEKNKSLLEDIIGETITQLQKDWESDLVANL